MSLAWRFFTNNFMDFKISDKVVCVDDTLKDAKDPNAFHVPNGFIKKGELYVVAEILEVPARWRFNLRLVGMPAFYLYYDGSDWGYQFWRFRRLEELKEEAKLKMIEPALA